MSADEPKLKFRPISPQNDFPKMEEKLLEMWELDNIYEKTQELRSKSGPLYTWLEGPPTANGEPHAGHALTRTLKDVMLRYQTMKGKYVVPRIGGWDCHGLPVELEIEKELGLNSKQEIEEYGIAEFNAKCRESVLRYTQEWIDMSKRIGFWLDMENSYVTMEDDYIESVWWSLKTLFERGLIYKGTRVAPYCSRCGTTLSSHELAQGYAEVTDPAIFIKFQSEDADFKYLAWTTTPWTLISNVMLSVNPEYDYVVVEYEGEKLLLAEGLVRKVFKLDDDQAMPEVLERFKGKELEGRPYTPIFPFFAHYKEQSDVFAFKVTLADYVELESGTGIVHSAPAFGADDAETGNKYGAPVVNPVDGEGKFDERVTLFKGLWVKDADKEIIKTLKKENKLFRREQYVHNYPHCWRCDTPLLYYGTESWFIRMSELRDRLTDNNNKIFWQPDYIKTGRFGNFLENVVDWNLSRSRYWGCPLPAWKCNTCGKNRFIGGKDELRELSGELPDKFELHRPWVDDITWSCDCGGSFERENYTIDVWYESGAATFAQYHYPFENQDKFDESNVTYNFITEAIDQTRGWFYSLHAVATALFDQPAYESVLCMNHVLAEDGSKMSKSRGNAMSPDEMFNTVGADATRWYLCATPAWNPMRFSTKLVAEAKRRVFNTLWNVYSFFVTNANVDNYDPANATDVNNRSDLDRWIISRLQEVISAADKAYNDIMFHLVTKEIDYFVVEELSNWFVRRSRRRFYGSEMTQDKQAGYDTLYEVLTALARLLGPITPYLAEELYQNLERSVSNDSHPSVHMQLLPIADTSLIDEDLEKRMGLALQVTNAARTARAESGIKARQPLPRLVIHLEEDSELPDELREVIKEELNVKVVEVVESDEGYVDYKVQPLLKVLAPKVKGAIKGIKSYLEALDRSTAKDLVTTMNRSGQVKLEIDGQEWEFTSEELLVHAQAADGFSMGQATGLSVFLEISVTDELRSEGMARGVVRHIQEARKQADLDYLDRIAVKLSVDGEVMVNAINDHLDYIKSETQADSLELVEDVSGDPLEIDGFNLVLDLKKV
ncbi:MAG: isoleucine--tRNA ligase [Candidatus Kariarchaeaceae archaeon]|jgi:isoleucyl-tRNA synthetase